MTGRVKGENQERENPFPKTRRKDFHDLLLEETVSFLRCSIPVSSFQIAWTCTPNIIRVKMAKRSASKTRQTRRIMVHGVGGEPPDEEAPVSFEFENCPQMDGHFFQSESIHFKKCNTAISNE
jgi:hypothetical protein